MRRARLASPLLLAIAGCAPRTDLCAVSWSADTVPVELSRFAASPGAARLLGAVPVTLAAPTDLGKRDADVTVTLGGPFTALDATGAPLTGPWTGTLADLPRTFYVEASSTGAGTLTASVGGCDATVDVPLTATPVSRLAGRLRDAAPGFAYDDVYASGEPVDVALDPRWFPDGLPATASVTVVPHRTLDAWADDPTLSVAAHPLDLLPASGDPTGTDPAFLVATAWDTATAEGLGGAYDLVVDVDGDGALSPGDHLDQGLTGEGIRVVGDLAAAGPHPVSQEDVSGGDWLGERVYWPDDLADLGPRPLVVISHGNGHDYTWYDYLGQHLASWGYVVMSHQNNTQPGIETASTTTLTNTDWFLGNLDTVGDGALVGLVDGTRIAWIGHSRGGEGVVRAYARIRDGEYTPTEFVAEDIRAITSIAPTVFYEVNVSDPHDVRYHVLAGSADGDVTGGPEVPQTQSFRLYQAATGTRSSTYIYGASHEDFDCCGRPEGDGPDQLEREDVQVIAKAYLLAMVEENLDGDPYAHDALTHDPMHVPGTAFTTTVQGTFRPAGALVLDDFQENPETTRASRGAPVTFDVDNVSEGAQDDADTQLTWTGDDPMNGMTQAEGAIDQGRGVVFDWEAPGTFRYDLPGDQRDWSSHQFLAMNACQGTRHPRTVDLAGPVTFAVTLEDGAGVRVTRPTAPIAEVPTPYQRGRDGDGKGWANAFSTIRMPLDDFAAGTTLDLADIRAVELNFGLDGDAPEGRLGLDDVEVEP